MIRIDGVYYVGCPYKEVEPRAFEILSYHSDWIRGHTPVTTGRAPWLPTPFMQAMHATDAAFAQVRKQRADEKKAARDLQGGVRLPGGFRAA